MSSEFETSTISSSFSSSSSLMIGWEGVAFLLVCWSGRVARGVARGIPSGIALGDEKTRNGNAYLVQAWVLGFYNAL